MFEILGAVHAWVDCTEHKLTRAVMIVDERMVMLFFLEDDSWILSLLLGL